MTGLDAHGYVVLPGVIDAAWLAALRTGFEAGAGPAESGTRHTGELGREPPWDRVAAHPAVHALIAHLLGPAFRLRGLNGRDPLPGYGQQGLHADWGPRGTAEPYLAATAIWLLDNFTADNGATRVVQGTHRLIRPLPKDLAAPAAHHPDERLVIAPAGSVLVMNGHLWHSGTRNQSSAPRRVLQATYDLGA